MTPCSRRLLCCPQMTHTEERMESEKEKRWVIVAHHAEQSQPIRFVKGRPQMSTRPRLFRSKTEAEAWAPYAQKISDEHDREHPWAIPKGRPYVRTVYEVYSARFKQSPANQEFPK